MADKTFADGLHSNCSFITTQDQLSTAMRALAAQPFVAVDTESNSFHAYRERICLIQLSIPGLDFIVDPLLSLDLSALGEVFANPVIQKVFHAAEQDVAGLRRDFGFALANLFDTMWAARILGWPQIGLVDLMWTMFGVRTDKKYQRYNWGKRPLAPEALAYARRDTHYLLPLRERLAKELAEKGRAEEARQVFIQLAHTPAAKPPFGPDGFWRMKGVRDLSGREQAVLWQLYLWRDRVAKAQDRAPFRVIADSMLLMLARACPRTPADLAAMRGIPAQIARRYGQALLAAIAAGQEGPIPEPPPQPPRPEEADMQRFQALRAWRQGVAAQRGVAADVVLSNAMLWALAKRRPTTLADLEGIEGLDPWKRSSYGSDILRVLRRQVVGPYRK